MRGGRLPTLPNGPSLVLRDVLAHRDSSINEICERTSLPQSYVSESVARLRDRGVLETRVDGDDRRRTLVRVSARHARTIARKAATPIDDALAGALGPAHSHALEEVLEALEMLAERLSARPPGPILRRLRESAERNNVDA